jgi:hypothetical protein
MSLFGVAVVLAENRADIEATAAEGAIGRDAGSKEAQPLDHPYQGICPNFVGFSAIATGTPDKGSDQLLGRIWRGYGCGAASAIRRAADVSAHISTADSVAVDRVVFHARCARIALVQSS